jgi:hypothetical protein
MISVSVEELFPFQYIHDWISGSYVGSLSSNFWILERDFRISRKQK